MATSPIPMVGLRFSNNRIRGCLKILQCLVQTNLFLWILLFHKVKITVFRHPLFLILIFTPHILLNSLTYPYLRLQTRLQR